MESRKLDVIVVENDEALEAFLRLPWKIYETDHCWVPPLLQDQRRLFSARNPFLHHAEMCLFLARAGGQTLGRIAAIVDHELVRTHREKVGCFGFFECIQDYDVAEALFSAVEGFLRERGMERVRGPLNPSIHDESGLLIEGYGLSPSLLMAYNPPYYVSFVEEYGFRKAKDYFSFAVDLRKPPCSTHLNVLSQLRRSGITLRTMNAKRFDEEVELLRQLYNTTFIESRHWGFVPMTLEEARAKGESFKTFFSPELVWFAEAGGQPIGFFLNLPDMSPVLRKLNGRLGLWGSLRFFTGLKRLKGVRSVVLGVLKDYARRGVASSLLASAISVMQRKGYRDLEWSWVMEDNLPSIGLITKFGGRKYKSHRIYEKDIH